MRNAWQVVAPPLLTFSPLFLAMAATSEATWSTYVAYAAALGLGLGLALLLRVLHHQREEIGRLRREFEAVAESVSRPEVLTGRP